MCESVRLPVAEALLVSVLVRVSKSRNECVLDTAKELVDVIEDLCLVTETVHSKLASGLSDADTVFVVLRELEVEAEGVSWMFVSECDFVVYNVLVTVMLWWLMLRVRVFAFGEGEERRQSVRCGPKYILLLFAQFQLFMRSIGGSSVRFKQLYQKIKP